MPPVTKLSHVHSVSWGPDSLETSSLRETGEWLKGCYSSLRELETLPTWERGGAGTDRTVSSQGTAFPS